jgi:uncharacterized surface protein with fasciclin (FAS1) repeats
MAVLALALHDLPCRLSTDWESGSTILTKIWSDLMNLKSILFTGFAAILLVVAPSRAAEQKDIVDTAVEAKFNTLVAAIQEAGLTETLKGKGPFTVFAPTDEAFKKIPADKLKAVMADKALLKKILLAHVVVGSEVKAAEVVKLDGQRVNGFEISTKDGVRIGEAKVTKTDIITSNGVIHVIDTVLMPTN